MRTKLLFATITMLIASFGCFASSNINTRSTEESWTQEQNDEFYQTCNKKLDILYYTLNNIYETTLSYSKMPEYDAIMGDFDELLQITQLIHYNLDVLYSDGSFDYEPARDQMLYEITLIEVQIASLESELYEYIAAYNTTAKENLEAKLQELTDIYNKTREYIETECPDVADNYADDLESIYAKLQELSNSIESTNEFPDDTATNLEITAQDIEDLLETLKEEARIAQENATSSIIDIDCNAMSGTVQIFTLDGRPVAKPIKGQVNIFRFSNGTTLKAFVK